MNRKVLTGLVLIFLVIGLTQILFSQNFFITGSTTLTGSAVSPPLSTCPAKAGDINTDGKVDLFDLSLLVDALSGRRTLDQCQEGISTFSVGDITQDKSVSVIDLQVLLSKVLPLTPLSLLSQCPTTEGDVDGDGIVSVTDLQLVSDVALGRTTAPTCVTLQNARREVTDINNQVGTNHLDVTYVTNMLLYKTCSGVAGDVDNNNKVNEADLTALIAMLHEDLPLLRCKNTQQQLVYTGDLNHDQLGNVADITPLVPLLPLTTQGPTLFTDRCPTLVGDLTGDEQVNAADLLIMINVVMGRAQTKTCLLSETSTRMITDLNNDGATNILDLERIIKEVLTAPPVHIPACSTLSLDVNNDGAVTVHDLQQTLLVLQGNLMPFFCRQGTAIYQATDVNRDLATNHIDFELLSAQILPTYQTPVSLSTCPTIFGDVNGDNTVNVMDLQLTINVVKGTAQSATCMSGTQQRAVTDLNNDGATNIFDLQRMIPLVLVQTPQVVSPTPPTTPQCTSNSQCGAEGRCVDGRCQFTDGNNNNGGSIRCYEQWECLDYGACVNGMQTRTCTDTNGCNNAQVLFPKPQTQIACGTSAIATCFDKIQNQRETGLDCGGPCPSCPVVQPTFECSNFDPCEEGFSCESGYCIEEESNVLLIALTVVLVLLLAGIAFIIM